MDKFKFELTQDFSLLKMSSLYNKISIQTQNYLMNYKPRVIKLKKYKKIDTCNVCKLDTKVKFCNYCLLKACKTCIFKKNKNFNICIKCSYINFRFKRNKIFIRNMEECIEKREILIKKFKILEDNLEKINNDIKFKENIFFQKNENINYNVNSLINTLYFKKNSIKCLSKIINKKCLKEVPEENLEIKNKYEKELNFMESLKIIKLKNDDICIIELRKICYLKILILSKISNIKMLLIENSKCKVLKNKNYYC